MQVDRYIDFAYIIVLFRYLICSVASSESPRAIYVLELLGLCWGIISITLLMFVPKMIYVVWPTDAVEGHVNTRTSMDSRGSKSSKLSDAEMPPLAEGVYTL